MDKKILATLELADHEVRLIVGQFFNGRLNVLKVERVAHEGIRNFKIINTQSVRQAIIKSITNASENIGGEITRVLVCLPGVDLQIRDTIQTVQINQFVTGQDLENLYERIVSHSRLNNHVLVNANITRFHINGMTTRKVPLNEKCRELTAEADCYFIDKTVAFDYLKVIESTGLEVLDIVIDDLGLAKEAGLFEQSIHNPVIAVTLERDTTKLSLFNKGQLLTNIFTDDAVGMAFEKFESVYGFTADISQRLIYYNLDVSNVSPTEDPIFAWNTKKGEHTLSQKDVLDFVGNEVIHLLDQIHKTSTPIYEHGEATFMLTGEASVIEGLPEILKTASQKNVSTYVPTTFGVKDPVFTSMLGVFYHIKDTAVYRKALSSSIDETGFYNKNIYKETKHDTKSESFTGRLKNLFID